MAPRTRESNRFSLEYADPVAPDETNENITDVIFSSCDTVFSEDLNIKLGTEDQSRLFYLNDENRMVSLENADLVSLRGRFEFASMVRSNRLFAVPAGENSPVQVQYYYDSKDGSRSILMADNLDVKPSLGGWVSFWSYFGFYKEEVADYNAKMQVWEKTNSVVKSVKDARSAQGFSDTLKDSKQAGVKEMEDHAARIEAGKEIISHQDTLIQLDREASDAEKQVRAYEESIDAVRSIYSSYPRFKENFLPRPKDEKGRDISGNKNVYTKEEFDLLKNYDLQLAPNGSDRTPVDGKVALTDDDFIALAMCAASLPEISGNARNDRINTKDLDPAIRADQLSTMFTADLSTVAGGESVPRERLGGFFNVVIQPARERAAAAVAAYLNGDKVPMANLAANGLMFYGRTFAYSDPSSMQQVTLGRIFGKLGEVLENDAELKALTEKQREVIRENDKAAQAERIKAHEAFLEKNGEKLEAIRALHQAALDIKSAGIKLNSKQKQYEKDDPRLSELKEQIKENGVHYKAAENKFVEAKNSYSEKTVSIQEELLNLNLSKIKLENERRFLSETDPKYRDIQQQEAENAKQIEAKTKELQEAKKNNNDYFSHLIEETQHVSTEIYGEVRINCDLGKTLETLKANVEAGNIHEKAAQAKAAILRSSASEKTVSAEDKEKYVSDIVSSKILAANFANENVKTSKSADLEDKNYSKFDVMTQNMECFTSQELVMLAATSSARTSIKYQVNHKHASHSELHMSLTTNEGKKDLADMFNNLVTPQQKAAIIEKSGKDLVAAASSPSLVTQSINRQRHANDPQTVPVNSNPDLTANKTTVKTV